MGYVIWKECFKFIKQLTFESDIYYSYRILQQEPSWNGVELMNGLKYVRPGNGFVPNFPLTEKVDVNGNLEHKMFTYLKV